MADAAELAVGGISLAFGGHQVLSDVSLGFRPGQVTGLIGPNGAGKTSLFNCLTGLYRPQGGTITLSVTATNSAGSTPPATAALAVPAAPPGPQPDPSPYQPDMTTGRIAQITTSFGGRPNVVPATYYFNGQDEMASMSMGA